MMMSAKAYKHRCYAYALGKRSMCNLWEITSIWKRCTESTKHNGQDIGYDNDSELFRYRPENLTTLLNSKAINYFHRRGELAKSLTREV